jgi:hypothetical protein
VAVAVVAGLEVVTVAEQQAELAAAVEELPTRLYLSEEEVLAFLGRREGARKHG